MAVGDKFPVVMGREKAVPNGVATLGADGILTEAQRPTTDATPTQGSDNPVQSGGVYTALAGKADLTLSNLSNYQKALRNIGGRTNRNLLDNWYFVGGGSQQGGGQFPINQRGQTSYTGNSSAIDRWQLDKNQGEVSLTLQNGYVRLQQVEVGQKVQAMYESIERYRLIEGETYTISVLCRGSSSCQLIIFLNDSVYKNFQFQNTSNFSIHSYQFVVPELTADKVSVYLYADTLGSLGYTDYIACKLEIGPTQTLAYQDEDGNWQLFETPDYGEELAKCQRYYLPIDGVGRFPAVFSSTSTILQVFIPTPVTMRSVPTVLGITSLSVRVYTGAANSQTLSVSEVLKTETGVLIIFSCSWPGSISPAAYSNAVVVFGQRGALSAEL